MDPDPPFSGHKGPGQKVMAPILGQWLISHLALALIFDWDSYVLHSHTIASSRSFFSLMSIKKVILLFF